MFSESLLDSSSGRARRGWSTLIAWTFQSALIVAAVVLPLWQTNALPHTINVLTPIGPPPGAPAPKSRPVGHTPSKHPLPIMRSDVLTMPLRVPTTIDRTPDASQREDVAEPPCPSCVEGGIPGGTGPGLGILRNIIPPTEATPPPKPPSRLIVSAGVSQGFLVHQVQPVYPAIARAARMQGTVVLVAVINRDGSIQGLHAVSGPPMLVTAAMDAVRQWRYRPYMLGTQPVEVETQISVIFTLAH
jgi:periplasmic protein TonB